ncbi:MAG TPA: taurine ABC transporter substrate-binding protein [Candidatus Aquabacterium excrementipullorum]|nr:taurine ABC transporter substrate-binding protein [Candidatus Aquabacterium excrementipullorum]
MSALQLLIKRLGRTACLAAAVMGLATQAASAAEVTVGYQTGVEPAKAALADGLYEKATGAKINWRKFDNGAELVRALASGDVDVANLGSSVVAAAASRKLPVQTFLVAAQLGTSEALVVRNSAGIKKPADLVGKTIAVPFVSTSHYSLLSAFKHWGVDATKVKVINLRISEIAAAWTRGDIHGAYVWEPALGRIKESGTVLATSADVAQWGAPTFDLWVARKPFADKNAAFLRQFAKVSVSAYEAFRANPDGFIGDAANLQKIARVTGAKPEDVKVLLRGDRFPTAAEQRQLLGAPVAKAFADTAAFLKAQGKLDALLPDYSGYVTNTYIGP